jgi:3-deoxy-manno-octulosonate cytidylyltransferase (CMP-KDO synthetase)
MTTAIFIPARLASSRFPEKILTLIDGKPMIIHVLERAQSLNMGECYVACCSEKIKKLVEEHGGKAILTDPDLPSGTDRIYAALETLHEKPEIIVNLQGDMPVFSTSIVKEIIEIMYMHKSIDMATPVVKIENPEHITNVNKVKVVFENMETNEPGRAIYFSREPIPNGAQQFYLHIGVYAYRYESLSKFVELPPSYLEKTERLEQLRCLENGIDVWAVPVDGYAVSVDVPGDLSQVNCCNKNTIY